MRLSSFFRVKRAASLPRNTAGKSAILPGTTHLSHVPIDVKVNSRQRTLSILGENSESAEVVSNLNVQLEARDRLIADLNEELIGLKTAIKTGEGQSVVNLDRNLRILTEEKVRNLNEMKALQERNLALETESQQGQVRVQEDKETLQSTVETLQVEVANLQSQIASKQSQVHTSKEDIVHLNNIVQGMTKLNGELTDKIANLTAEFITATKLEYEATLKSTHIEEVEAEISQLRTENRKIESQLALVLVAEHLHKSAIEKAVQLLEATISLLPADSMVPKIRHNVADALDLLKTKETEEIGGNVDNWKLRTEESEVQALKRDLRKSEATQVLHLHQIEKLENECNKMSLQVKGMQDDTKKRLEMMQELVDRYRNRANELDETNEKLKENSGKVETEAKLLRSKLDLFKEKMNDLKQMHEHLLKNYKRQQMDFLELKSDRTLQDIGSKARERGVKDIQTKVTVLTEALWMKETELLKKESEKLRLEEEVQRLRSGWKMQSCGGNSAKGGKS